MATKTLRHQETKKKIEVKVEEEVPFGQFVNAFGEHFPLPFRCLAPKKYQWTGLYALAGTWER